MILLIGGTSETAPLATGLATAGYEILVSTATDTPLAIGAHPGISRRSGPLDTEGLIALGRKKGLRAIVDAAHPYAVAAHETVQTAAQRLGIPCLVFRRPEMLTPNAERPNGKMSQECAAGAEAEEECIRFAADHAEAAVLAFADGRPVLLTTGSRNLAPYTEAARRCGLPLLVRVLDTPESLAACRAAGIPAERIITGRGPFSLEENLAAIRRGKVGVVVTKESGHAGGLEEKVAAARLSRCRLVVIRRPPLSASLPTFAAPADLIAALRKLVPPLVPQEPL